MKSYDYGFFIRLPDGSRAASLSAFALHQCCPIIITHRRHSTSILRATSWRSGRDPFVRSMLSIWQASGNKLASFPVEEVTNVCDAKKRLSKLCGASRFRQRLLRDGTILNDNVCLTEPADLHLVLLPYCHTTDSHKERVNAAIRRGNSDYVESMLQGPHDPEALTTPLSSPMLVASYYKCLEIAKLLLEARADADRAVQDETPLFVAAAKGALGIVQLLLDAGADKDRSCRGMTPLFADTSSTLQQFCYLCREFLLSFLDGTNISIRAFKNNAGYTRASPLCCWALVGSSCCL